MEITIDFTCPSCHQIIPLPLELLGNNHRKRCGTCRSQTVLTDEGLTRFSHQVKNYCQPSEGS